LWSHWLGKEANLRMSAMGFGGSGAAGGSGRFSGMELIVAAARRS
jgi:hypothetical protein